MLSIAQQHSIRTICTVLSGTLSFIGPVYIILEYLQSRRRQGRPSEPDATKNLVLLLAVLDIPFAISHGLSIYPAQGSSDPENVATTCTLQAFSIMFTDWTLLLWNACIAHNLMRWVCFADSQHKLASRLKTYVLVTLVPSVVVAVLGLADNAYGNAGLWCWINSASPRKEALWMYLGLYVWVVVGIAVMVHLLIRVRQNVDERVQGVLSDEAKQAYRSVVRSQSIFVLGFVACWLPGLLHRTLIVATGKDEVFPLNILQALIRPLQGFVNAVVYGNFDAALWRCFSSRSQRRYASPAPIAPTNFTRLRDVQDHENKYFGARATSLFFATVDMTEEEDDATFHTATWIPHGQDIYVFTLLNCCDPATAEQGLGETLLSMNHPAGFRSITALSSTSVCQIVFINDVDLSSGALTYELDDASMWRRGQPMRRVVGVRLHAGGTNMALVSCNMVGMAMALLPSNIATPVGQAHALGLDVARFEHVFLCGQLPDDRMGVARHSHERMQGNLRRQRSWVADNAHCSLFELDIDRSASV